MERRRPATPAPRVPFPDKALLGWMHKTARKHYWRVAHSMDLMDLQQEGWKVYCKVRYVYGNMLPTPLFQALFMRSYENRIFDLAKKVRNWKNEIRECELDSLFEGEEGSTPLDRLQEAEQNNDLQGVLMVIAEAPSPAVRQLLVTFLTEKAALISKPIFKRLAKDTETPAQFVGRILGIDPVVARKVIRETKDYLHGALA